MMNKEGGMMMNIEGGMMKDDGMMMKKDHGMMKEMGMMKGNVEADVALSFFTTLLLGNSKVKQSSDKLWDETLRRELKNHFSFNEKPNVPSSVLEFKRILTSDVTCLELLFTRIQTLTGLHFTTASQNKISLHHQKMNGEGETTFTREDFARVEAKVKKMEIVPSENPTLLSALAQLQEAESALLRKLKSKEDKISLITNPTNVALSLEAEGISYHHQCRRQACLTMQELGELYTALPKRQNQAKAMFLEALRLSEEEFGPESGEVARALFKLGTFYRRLGTPEAELDAINAFQRMLTISEKIEAINTSPNKMKAMDPPSGADGCGGGNNSTYIGTLLALMNIGEIRMSQGKYRDCEPIFQRCLSIINAPYSNNMNNNYNNGLSPSAVTPISQPKHISTVGTKQPKSMSQSLANSMAGGVPVDSEQPGPVASTITCSLMVRVLHNVASVCSSLGDNEWAEHYCTRAANVVDRMAVLGTRGVCLLDQKGVAILLDRLGQTYTDQRRIGDAERVFMRAINIVEGALGKNSYHVATIMNNMAYLFSANDCYENTEALYKKSISILENTLGPDHSEVGVTVGNLAVLYKRQGRFEEATPLFERALHITKTQLGEDHPKLSDVYYNIHSMFFKQRKWAQALPYLEKSIAIDEKVFGHNHPEVIQSKIELVALQNKIVATDNKL